ncbi:hypothetical protein DFA_09020 [Cavenderia fasciculata]|uniref:Uncharacterized protein n=1 Tax=Cavenderia fasciculata TaxID=261658 RepID=F4Q6H2_CACFS|nr:uncharacterized protein DFA_09020 [Cavenderia fasciculata]EGG16482.1 hypothetical protein DFA_09020 [Cavenderia fasciculata]|eukprot:XP_004354882.1 hypothetical protein DFA_09020 [Cavenderia fasciculata]
MEGQSNSDPPSPTLAPIVQCWISARLPSQLAAPFLPIKAYELDGVISYANSDPMLSREVIRSDDIVMFGPAELSTEHTTTKDPTEILSTISLTMSCDPSVVVIL